MIPDYPEDEDLGHAAGWTDDEDHSDAAWERARAEAERNGHVTDISVGIPVRTVADQSEERLRQINRRGFERLRAQQFNGGPMIDNSDELRGEKP